MSKKGGDGAASEVDEVKSKLLATQLEIVTYMDQVRRTQQRSYEIELHIIKLTADSKEKIQTLEDIINLLNADAKVKDNQIVELETGLAKLISDSVEATKRMNKEMDDARAEFEFKYKTLEIQLDAAQIRLRELNEFILKKAQIEQELQDTRIALLKEHESKLEMVGEAERALYAAKDQMKKQLETIVAETEARMTKTIELRLHSKTKKTIIENQQLKSEVHYHSHATLQLRREKEQLVEENHEITRQVNLLRGVQVQLEQKVLMYLKTLRILVNKFREKERGVEMRMAKVLSKPSDEEKKDEEVFQELLIRIEHLKDVKVPKGHKSKGDHLPNQKLIREAAIELLYASLEDMELDTFTRVAKGIAETSELPSDVPLDQLNEEQRHDLLRSLLKRAAAVRLLARSLDKAAPDKNLPPHQPYTPAINDPNPGESVVVQV